MNSVCNIGVAERIGTYSDAVETSGPVRWLITAGTPGLAEDGTLPPDFSAQAELAWHNLMRLLHGAGMDAHDLVKITQTLIRRSDLDAYRPIRSRFLGNARPAAMLSFVNELVWPGMLIELEAVAAKS